MANILLTPPIAFIIMLAGMLLFSLLISLLTFKGGKQSEGTRKSYACGEDVPTNLIQPDYGQFFPFAFFFTILHVVALMLATVPRVTGGIFTIAVIYILGAIIGLVILFRR
jgi:NADH-quinone oxidoreductase subunit A